MKMIKLPLLAAGLALLPVMSHSLLAHGSEEAMEAFMKPYEAIEQALAGDDLAAAQKAAQALPLDKNAQAIAASKDLDEARKAFKGLSKKAVAISGDDEGYYVFSCSMVKEGYWVQTTEKCANPYKGKAMSGCGKMMDKAHAAEMSKTMGQDMGDMHSMHHD